MEKVGVWILDPVSIDLIAIVSARKAKSRAQLTTMRTTVAYRGTKLFFFAWLQVYSPYFNIEQTDFTHVNAICNVLKFEKVKSDVVL